TQPWDHDANPTTRPRYRATPQYVQNADTDFIVQKITDVPSVASHLEATATFTLDDLAEDTWIVALVHGTDGVSHPLFPVQPFGLNPATNTTLDDLTDGNLGEGGELALAFTNPLYLDVEPTGWTAPGVRLTPP